MFMAEGLPYSGFMLQAFAYLRRIACFNEVCTADNFNSGGSSGGGACSADNRGAAVPNYTAEGIPRDDM